MSLSESEPTPEVIAHKFAESYYKMLVQEDTYEKLTFFYNKDAVITRGDEADEHKILNPTTGTENIKKELQQLHKMVRNCRVELTVVDSQCSVGGGVLVTVIGAFVPNTDPTSMTSSNNDNNSTASSRRFVQIFFLIAENASNYSIRNDILRYFADRGVKTVPVESTDKNTLASTLPFISNITTTTSSSSTSTSAAVSLTTTSSVPISTPPSNETKETKQSIAFKKDSSNTTNGCGTKQQTSKIQPIEKESVMPERTTTTTTTSNTNQTLRDRYVDPDQNDRERSLFVKNLPNSATTHKVKNIFTKYGTVINVNLMSQGYGFIDFATPGDVQRVLRAVTSDPQHFTLDGYQLIVEERRPRGYRNQNNKPRNTRVQKHNDKTKNAGVAIYQHHEGQVFVLCGRRREPDKRGYVLCFLGGHATDSDQTAAHTAAREFIEETCDDDTNLSQEEIELIDILTKHLQTQPSIPVFGNAIRQFVCRFSDLPLRIQQRIPALNERKTLQNKEIKEIYWERIDQITKENGFPPPIIEGLKNSLKENLFRDQSLTLQPKR